MNLIDAITILAGFAGEQLDLDEEAGTTTYSQYDRDDLNKAIEVAWAEITKKHTQTNNSVIQFTEKGD